MITLRYGHTSTFLIQGDADSLLVDTDYAGTLHALYKALKRSDVRVQDIGYVMATHYHPDHMGLIGELMRQGVKLLLVDVQQDFVHFSDGIFARDGIACEPIDETRATVISCAESRSFLQNMGVAGQIVHTPSHSADSVSLVLDDGSCLVGDLQPFEHVGAFDGNEQLEHDWENLLALHPKTIHYAHWPAMPVA